MGAASPRCGGIGPTVVVMQHIAPLKGWPSVGLVAVKMVDQDAPASGGRAIRDRRPPIVQFSDMESVVS